MLVENSRPTETKKKFVIKGLKSATPEGCRTAACFLTIRVMCDKAWPAYEERVYRPIDPAFFAQVV
jgi:hypothetical protein